MQAATKATLTNLVEQHVTSLVRECAVVNRHSKRSGFVSAAADNDDYSDNDRRQRRKKRLLIHHDDVNLALAWRGSEKLYVSGVPLKLEQQQQQPASSSSSSGGGGFSGVVEDSATAVTDDDGEKIDGNNRKRRKNTPTSSSSTIISPLGRLLRATTTAATANDTETNSTTIPALLASSTVPRIDLNAYLHSELMVRPPSELKMTLHWLAVEGVMPRIPPNEVGNHQVPTAAPDFTPALLLLDQDDMEHGHDDEEGDNITARKPLEDDEDDDDHHNNIRIRELQHRLLSEELQLYYSYITFTISNPNISSDDFETYKICSSIRHEGGHIQELVPFLSRFVASGLMTRRRNLRNAERCIKLVRIVEAMLDNANLHLDLHLHQLFIPLGTCVVAKNLSDTTTTNSSSTPLGNHWTLREEAAKCLVKACDIYGDQYTTMRPRLIKLLTQQALRKDRPLATQFGGIVGISLFGPRAIDAFILPLAREYWECWEEELRTLRCAIATSAATAAQDGDTASEGAHQRKKRRRRTEDAEGREYALHMCQRALLSAIHIFMRNVANAEKSKRVDVRAFMDVFGERLIPMQPDMTDYMTAII